MQEEVAIDRIISEYSETARYSEESIARMASSLSTTGQLSAVLLRPSQTNPGKFELVCGHRRLLAAKHLGWSSIRADVRAISDKDLAVFALVENIEREQLSDYEKGAILSDLNENWQMSCEKIGSLIGLSKQQVSGYIAMTKLFDEQELSRKPRLKDALNQITEHHSRIISRVQDHNEREILVHLTVNEGLSTRNLANIVSRLRSWFARRQDPNDGSSDSKQVVGNTREIEEITEVVLDEFRLAKSGDFRGYTKIHLLDKDFTMYDSFPPLERFNSDVAMLRDRDLHFDLVQNTEWKIEDLQIAVEGYAAVATFRVLFRGGKKKTKLPLRASMVLLRRGANWKIWHEHWSKATLSSKKENPPLLLTRHSSR